MEKWNGKRKEKDMTMIPPTPTKSGSGGSKDECCKACGKPLHLHKWKEKLDCENRWAKEDR